MKAVLLSVGGRTMGVGKQYDVPLSELEAKLARRGIDVIATAAERKMFRRAERTVVFFEFEGATVAKLEEGRSAGAAAGGAIAGALLLGPLGLLAGAALGGRKKRVLVLQRDPENTLVFEATSDDIKQLAIYGVLVPP